MEVNCHLCTQIGQDRVGAGDRRDDVVEKFSAPHLEPNQDSPVSMSYYNHYTEGK